MRFPFLSGVADKRPPPITLVPPAGRLKGAKFLRGYYASMERERSVAASFGDVLVGLALLVWLPFRAAQVSVCDRRSLRWFLSTLSYSALNFTDPLEVSLFALVSGSGAQFMRRFELGGVMRLLNPAGWERGCVLNDKDAFRLYCERQGLPCPKWFATAGSDFAKSAYEPHGDLVLKPASGKGGKGVRLARYSRGLFYVGDEEGVTYERLLRRLQIGRKVYIVQNRAISHPTLARFGASALATARMTTCIDENGAPELVVSYLRMAVQKDAIIDNISAGGLIAAIDPATGILKEGMIGKRARRTPAHPLSGERIEGTQLPFWKEAIALVVKAHAGLRNTYTCIAWDVAFTETGAILIEGNSKPCIIIQRATGVGLGASRFGQLIEFHLRKRRSGRST